MICSKNHPQTRCRHWPWMKPNKIWKNSSRNLLNCLQPTTTSTSFINKFSTWTFFLRFCLNNCVWRRRWRRYLPQFMNEKLKKHFPTRNWEIKPVEMWNCLLSILLFFSRAIFAENHDREQSYVAWASAKFNETEKHNFLSHWMMCRFSWQARRDNENGNSGS